MADAQEPIAIVGGTVLEPGGEATAAGGPARSLSFERGRLIEPGLSDPPIDPDRQIDAGGLYVAPGFIDLQINGGHGLDLAVDPSAMWDLAAVLPRYGVTSFLPTIISSPPDAYQGAIAALAERPDPTDPTAGPMAEPLGLHFEGPMLNPQRSGAHPVEHLAAPSLALTETWGRESGVRLVTLAPELDGADAVVAQLRDRGVVVSAGHSAATGVEAARAADRGVTMVTHLFNAMSSARHRAPGLTGVAMTDDRFHLGLIVDGVHVDPVMVDLAWRAAGADRIVLVSDAVAAMGMGPGRHRFGHLTVEADEQRVQTDDGTLAGSILTLDVAVGNTARFTGASAAEAIGAASTNPARALGLADRGRLGPGAVADIVLLDTDLRVVATICAGRLAHLADDARHRLGPGLTHWSTTAQR